MAKKIAILNFKGGVGKTTTAVNLADALRMLKKKVLLVDLDSQCSATIILDTNKEVDETIYDSLAPKKLEPLAVYEHSKGLDFVAADVRLSDIDELLVGRSRKEDLLKKLLGPAEDVYDYIIIDCPPNNGIICKNALTSSDSVLIPIDSRPMSLDGLKLISEAYADAKENLNESLTIEGYLITKFHSTHKSSKKVLNALKTAMPDKVFNTRIREITSVEQAPGERMTIFEYDETSAGADDYMSLAKELIKKHKAENKNK